MKLFRLAGVLFACAAIASATPIFGTMNFTGSVTVDANTINWFSSGGETGFGTIITVAPGTGYFANLPSPLPPTYTALERDITREPLLAGAAPAPALAPAGIPIFVPSFLSSFTAPGYENLFFDLTFIPISAAPLCTGAEAVGDSCRPDPTSPFTLTRLEEGTAIAFEAEGFFEDSSDATSRMFATGRYTTQLGSSIGEILATIAGGGSISASYSANFEAVPEPGTISLTVVGGLLIAGSVIRRRRAKI